MATITVQDKTFEVADGTRLTTAIENAGIDILHRCGGNGRCTTCKVVFVSGEPESMNETEKEKLEANGDMGDYRLSCQITCAGEMSVTDLMTMTSTGLDDAGLALTETIE